MCKILSLSWPLSCKYAEILWKALNMHGAWEVEVSKNRAAVCEAKVEFLFYQWRQKLRCWPMASEDKSSFAPVTSKLLLLNFSGKIKTNGVGAREQICLIRISTIRPSPAPAPGRLVLMLFANLFGLCRLFRFIVYKLQTDCFKKLASIRSARHQVLPVKVF